MVFDCFAAYRGASFNSDFIQGPNLMNTLTGVLVCFQLGNIVIMDDVEKMFHQVKVQPHHLNFPCFLWWPDGNVSQPLKDYRMTVHIFGATLSSSCTSYTLRRTTEDNKEHFLAEATGTVKSNAYVDNLLKAVDRESHINNLCEELKLLCADGGFKLTKWISNNKAVLAFILEPERARVIKSHDFDIKNLPNERALCIQWCVEEDVFQFQVSIKEHPCSRHRILSMISSMYDPVSFLAPLTFSAKHILQELCKHSVGWGEDLPEVHAQVWKQCWQDLTRVSLRSSNV